MAVVWCLMLLVSAAWCDVPTEESASEDILNSADGEAGDSLLILPADDAGSDEPARLRRRVRFVTALEWRTPQSGQWAANDLWTRTRLRSTVGRSSSYELLAVRRSSDPQTLDELHITATGRYEPARIQYIAGSYQLDWGLGLISSAGFGAIREFAAFRVTDPGPARGFIARPTAREAAWWRGAVVERVVGRWQMNASGSLREWNARTEAGRATLSGVLASGTPAMLAQRDVVEERAFSGTLVYASQHVSAGALGTHSRFSPELATSGAALTGMSLFARGQWSARSVQLEAARSGDRSAAAMILAQGTEYWRGAFYAMYASPKYFAPRSQGAFTFGEPVEGARTIGMRAGVVRGQHDFSAEVRSTVFVNADQLERTTSDFIGGWIGQVRDDVSVAARIAATVRDDSQDLSNVARSMTYRLESVWSTRCNWSVRFESRSQLAAHETFSRRGHYLHVQVVRPSGRVRPGARVASFSLDDLSAPLSVYEPNMPGVYPLEVFSGDGIRAAGWLTAILGDWRIQAKAAIVERDTLKTVREFSLAVSYWH